MIDVTVKVPNDRVAEFYQMYGAWLSSPSAVLAEGKSELSGGSSSPSQMSGKISPEPWTGADGELARVVWRKLTDPAKGLFGILIDSPGVGFRGDVLAERVGIPNERHGVAGVLAWPGRHSMAVGRALPWTWAYDEDECAIYRFSEEVAALFREARDR